ncbi:unnamed protein product [Amoebophrya sp. A120]|nr:unnamed protein product [Amoebophrya sp. A120]|eukprot:GSA120T00008739001.1
MLTRRRPYATAKKPPGKKGPKPGAKSERAEEMQAERRKRLQQQREEEERARAALAESLHGKKWKQNSDRQGFWEIDGDPSIAFQVGEIFFCENTGKEEVQVAGVWFQKESDGTYTVR